MFKKFKFDYDSENDSLFLYNPKSKSKASIEMDDLIIDFDTNKEISGVEMLNSTAFFKNLSEFKIGKNMLKKILDCKVEITSKENFHIIKFMIIFESNQKIIAPMYIPTLEKSSLAVA